MDKISFVEVANVWSLLKGGGACPFETLSFCHNHIALKKKKVEWAQMIYHIRMGIVLSIWKVTAIRTPNLRPNTILC